MPFVQASKGNAIPNRPSSSFWSCLLFSTPLILARILYTHFPVVPRQPPDDEVTVVCISDTHNTHPRLMAGDILVHAGDLTVSGTHAEIQATLDWLNTQPHAHMIVVAGNHDLLLDQWLPSKKDGLTLDWGSVISLDRSSATLHCRSREVSVYGSPYTPEHGNWVFQYPRSKIDIWRGSVPAGTDILVTHAPPKGHLDDHAYACEFLLEELWRVRPRLHVCGHVHCGHGKEWLAFDGLQKAYESVAAAGGWWDLMALLGKWVGVWWRGRRGRGQTVLVNAAVIGRTGDGLVREATVVRI